MRIGTNVELETSGGYCLYRETPFFGQMGTIYFFDELIPGSVIKLINTLGPNYSGVFQPHEYVPPAVSAALGGFEHHKLFDGSLASKLILSYNCRARDSLYFFDTSEATDKKIYDAQIYGNLNSCITRDVKDIIHCLGGTKVLLPLFAQLTQPLSPFKKKNIKKPPSKLKLATPPENNLLITMSGESIDSKESESEEENEQQEEEGEKGQEKENTINYSTSAEELAQVVALLKAMLSGSKTNQSELLRCRGIAVIGYCLQQVSPEHLTTNSLKEFSHLASVITLPGLLDELYINIFLNFRLWIYSKPDVQNELLTFIVEALHQRRDFFRGKYGFSFFLHILRNFYWYEPESSSQAIDPFFHPITPCKVRAVNSVPDQQYNNLTITFDGELFVSDLAYSEISEFQDVEVGTYTVVFIVNNEQVQLTFACVSSELSSLVLIGNPSSGVELEAEQLADQNYATLYNLIRFKVVLLSPDPDASPSSVFVDQDLLQVVSYPDETSYTDQSTLPFNISLVSHNLNYYSQEIDENSVDFGETYTFFVFGLINSDLYPIEIKAELDFSPETTTTTTTSGGDDDDDDDDDGLSGGAIAGIVIGVLFGVIILVAIALFVVRRHNNRNPPDNSYAQFTAVG